MDQDKKSELERIVIRWCEARNVGQLSRVGPDGPGKTQAMHEGYAPMSTWECDRIHAALCSMGRGVYFPMKLIEVLDFVYWHGHTVEEFVLFEPGRGLTSEVAGLGYRSSTLIEEALKRFWKALKRAVEEQPRPEAAKDFERT